MPVLRVRTEFELQDVVEALDQPADLVARDVQAIAPDAPDYEAAASILARALNDLLP